MYNCIMKYNKLIRNDYVLDFKTKNKRHQDTAETKLMDLGYTVKKDKADTEGLQTLYFDCQFPAEQINASKGEIEINDLRDEEKK